MEASAFRRNFGADFGADFGAHFGAWFGCSTRGFSAQQICFSATHMWRFGDSSFEGLSGVLEAKMGGLLGMGMMHEGLRMKQPYDTEIGPWCELNLLRE